MKLQTATYPTQENSCLPGAMPQQVAGAAGLGETRNGFSAGNGDVKRLDILSVRAVVEKGQLKDAV